MTDLNEIKINDYKIRYIGVDDDRWFVGTDVAKAIGYKKPRGAVSRHINNEDKRTKVNFVELSSLQRNTFLINNHGVRALIVNSRLPGATSIAQYFDINVHRHKYECKESETIGAIMKAFKSEKMRTQYPVYTYKVDLYFPDYDLCIECDENGHDDRSEKEERRRQRRITKKLKCKWIRFNPDADDFNIYDVIHQIFLVIKSNI